MEAVQELPAGQASLGRAARTVLGSLTAIGAISLDFYLMSLPEIARTFSSSPAAAQFTVSAFVITFGGGQLLWGPLSDRFGRRSTLFAGLALYMIASFGCAVAWSIESLIGWRLVQGLGACCGPVVARAMVRDAYRGQEASRVLAFMATILGLTPIVAPVFGALVAEFFSWRLQFGIMALAAFALLVATALVLRETHRPSNRGMSLVLQWLSAYAMHLRNRRLLFYTIIVSANAAGVFSFVTASAFVFIDELGASPFSYAVAFTVAAGGYAVGAMALMRSKAGDRTNLRRGMAIWGFAGLGLGILGFSELPHGVAGQVLLAFLLMNFLIGVGHVLPIAMSMALSAAEGEVGAASGLMGVIQYLVASVAGALVGTLAQGSHVGMCLGMALAAATGLSLLGLQRFVQGRRS